MFTETDHKEMAEAFESDKMREFCRWVIRESCFDGCDIDGGSVQEKATALGLLEPTVMTKEMVESGLYGEGDVGDRVFVFAGPIKT